MDNNIFIASRTALLLQICQFCPAFPIFPSSLTHQGPFMHVITELTAVEGSRRIHVPEMLPCLTLHLSISIFILMLSPGCPPPSLSYHYFLSAILIFLLSSSLLFSSLLPSPLLSSPQKHFKKQIRLLTGVRDWHFPPPSPAAGVPLYILADTAQLWAAISQFCESLTQWFISSASDKWPQLCK